MAFIFGRKTVAGIVALTISGASLIGINITQANAMLPPPEGGGSSVKAPKPPVNPTSFYANVNISPRGNGVVYYSGTCVVRGANYKNYTVRVSSFRMRVGNGATLISRYTNPRQDQMHDQTGSPLDGYIGGVNGTKSTTGKTVTAQVACEFKNTKTGVRTYRNANTPKPVAVKSGR